MLIVLAIVVSLVCVGSAIADWTKNATIMESMEHLRVPIAVRPWLPVFKVLGAAGLLIGAIADDLRWLAVAASVGLIAYFAGAVWFHLRAKDGPKDTTPAVVILAVCAVALVLSATAA